MGFIQISLSATEEKQIEQINIQNEINSILQYWNSKQAATQKQIAQGTGISHVDAITDLLNNLNLAGAASNDAINITYDAILLTYTATCLFTVA